MDADGNLDALNRHLQAQEEYDARFITCPQCDGEGSCSYDEPVADYTHGGYIKEVIDTCHLCDGEGEIEREEEE